MFHRRRKGRKYLHMYLYNYYIILLTWAFLIASGLCEISKLPAAKTTTTTTTMTTTTTTSKVEVRATNGKEQINQLVRSNLLKLFNLKEVPKPPKTKTYVPVEMLREYMKRREEMRDYIPDDRAFLGKINLDDLHPSDHNFWNEINNKYTHGIEIQLQSDEEGAAAANEAGRMSRKFFEGDLSEVSAIQPESDPQEIDPKMEPTLLPHTRKPFTSVHIKFNLSQEMWQKPYGAGNLRGAVLILNRQKLMGCHEGKCDKRFKMEEQSSSINASSKIDYDKRKENLATIAPNTTTTTTTAHYVPSYQRLYVNRIHGYDAHDRTPLTSILTSVLLDTRQSTPVEVDISKIVKEWLESPAKNYGIIIRVTPDDPAYEKYMMKQQSNQSTNASQTTTTTTTVDPRELNLEHVRLKRSFGSASVSGDIWAREMPMLTIYLEDNEKRRNVKREDKIHSDMDGALSDAPDASVDETSTSSNSQSASDGLNKSTTRSASSNQRSSSGSSSSSANKRDGRQKEAKPSGRNPSNRGSTTTPRRTTNNKAQKTEKCHLVEMTINFDEVGWSNWIIAPSSYSTNFCMGDCSFPLADHQNSTNHAIIQAIFHSVGRNIPRTCCAPTKLGKMAILYQLDHSVQMKYYDDMIVEACGCL